MVHVFIAAIIAALTYLVVVAVGGPAILALVAALLVLLVGFGYGGRARL